MHKLEKLGGIAAISLALIYIAAFIFYFTILDYPASSEMQQKLNYLNENLGVLSLFNLVTYVFFGIILALLTLAIHQRLVYTAPNCTKFATVFGFIWVVFVIAAGMIANIGLNKVVGLSYEKPELAMSIWITINIVVEGIGGGNEIVGGVWVLFISIAGLSARAMHLGLSYLGIFVGISGIATIYPYDLFTEIFGLSQIIWFVWVGVWLLRVSASTKPLSNQ